MSPTDAGEANALFQIYKRARALDEKLMFSFSPENNHE